MSDEKKTCGGTTKEGNPCRSPFVDDDGFCPAHRPDGSEEMARRGRKGGVLVHERREKSEKLADQLPALDSYESAEEWSWRVALGVVRGDIGTKEANAISRALRIFLEARGEKLTTEVVEDLRDEIDRLKNEMREQQMAGAGSWR